METDQPSPAHDANNNASKPGTPEDYVMVPDIPGAEDAKAEGNELYKQKLYRKALEKYQEAHRLYPTQHTYLGNIAATHLALENYKDALYASQEACKLDNTYVKGYSRQIKCQIYLGQTAAARSVLNEAEKHMFDASLEATFAQELQQMAQLERHLEMAKNAEAKQDHRQSQFFYSQACSIAVACPILKIKQAENMALAGQVPEAQAMAVRILQKDNRDANALYVRGLCFYLEDDTDKALKHFTQALQMDPDCSKAKHYRKLCKQLQAIKERGNAAFKGQKFEEAIDIYSEALEVDKTNKAVNSKLYYNRALARSKLREPDPDKAEQRDLLIIEDCDLAIELNPEYIKAYRRRALASQDVGNHDEAVRDFEKIFKLEQTRENKQAIHDAKRKQKLAERKDYYKILKVSKDADDKEIKKAYRKQAMLHHPDRHSGESEEKKANEEKLFKDVNEAFSVLSDPKKKQMYDNGQDLNGGGCNMGGGGMGDIDPNIIFQQFFGGGMGGGMGGGFPGGMGGGQHGFTFSFG